jgi:hypothetical protein
MVLCVACLKSEALHPADFTIRKGWSRETQSGVGEEGGGVDRELVDRI